MVQEPNEDEAVVFVTFFDVGRRIPSVDLVARMLQLYGMELAHVTPNSIVWLGVIEWALRAEGADCSAKLFAYLRNTR